MRAAATAVMATMEQAVWRRVARGGPADHWPFIGPRDRDGYGRVQIDGRKYSVPRLILAEKLGRELVDGEVSRHTCHQRDCSNPAHIIVGTQGDNMRDRDEAGRQARGERNGRSVLSEAQVIVARRLHAKGIACRDLAELLGVDLATIRSAVTGVTWASLSSSVSGEVGR